MCEIRPRYLGVKQDLKLTIESLKNKIIDKNNGNFNDLNDWESYFRTKINFNLLT